MPGLCAQYLGGLPMRKNGDFKQGFYMQRPISTNQSRCMMKDLIGEQSHLLFHLLCVGSNWLRQPVRSWKDSDEYLRVGEFLKNLRVVNDGAERCIKDISEYANITRDCVHG